jgi:hypothetical protein
MGEKDRRKKGRRKGAVGREGGREEGRHDRERNETKQTILCTDGRTGEQTKEGRVRGRPID